MIVLCWQAISILAPSSCDECAAHGFRLAARIFIPTIREMKQDAEGWIGWIEEIPGMNCQECAARLYIETLRVTIREALEPRLGVSDCSSHTGLVDECLSGVIDGPTLAALRR